MNITRRQHFIDAALLWTLVGSILGFFGAKWILAGFSNPWAFVFLTVCLVIGCVKGEVAIGKSAKRAIRRIEQFPEKTPFFRVFSRGQWLLVAAMMGLGMLLRMLHVDKSYRGLVLAAVGMALLWASRYFWKAACKSS